MKGVGLLLISARCERPVYTCDFLCAFSRALQFNFCRKCKLAAISARFGCNICCDFPNIHQVASSFEHARNLCDIAAATKRTEIGAGLAHTRQIKIALKIATKIPPKRRMYKPALRCRQYFYKGTF